MDKQHNDPFMQMMLEIIKDCEKNGLDAFNTIKEQFTEEKIREDLSKMDLTQLQEELMSWRMGVPSMVHKLLELRAFHEFATNPMLLAEKVNTMANSFQATIELKEKQIEHLVNILNQIQENPLKKNEEFDIKRKLN